MIIKDMFEKPINRDMNTVIKAGEKDEDIIDQELDEYVVTRELLNHFTEFFERYASHISNPTSDMGVWISGFYGSGKSHFLKILSYILDGNLLVKGKKPIEYFEEGKISDPLIIANMKKSAQVSTDVKLFNISSKSASDDKDIVKVFLKQFNSIQGYCDNDYFFLADLEKELDDENKLKAFKEEFKKNSGISWYKGRNIYLLKRDAIIQSLVNINYMSEESAKEWIKKSEDNYSITPEVLAEKINEYCEKKGNNHHIIFLVDEMGQYIGADKDLMLSLQTIVEELGIKCKGKVWVVVTSQQNIDDLVNVINDDFSKITGRFKTKLNLSSSNVNEVIRRRLLEKKEPVNNYLKSYYDEIEYELKNVLYFDNKAEIKKYANNEDFAEIYPFVPYQINLLQSVLKTTREHGSSGKDVGEGERSMLDFFHETAVRSMYDEDNTIIPFYKFYDSLAKHLDHEKSIVINNAIDNQQLDEFDVNILKTLLMIKHVDKIESNAINITGLMIENIKTDRNELIKKVEKSLQKLYNESLIGKNGKKYTFLTNDEQETNRAIKREPVDNNEIIDAIYQQTFNEIIDLKKYRYDKNHDFNFNKSVDNITKGNHSMGLRIITPLYEFNLNIENEQMIHNALRELSENEKEAIIYFKNDLLLEDIKNNIQIKKYLDKHRTDIKSSVRKTKKEEYLEQEKNIDMRIEESIKNSDVYIDGHLESIEEKNSKERINEIMTKLCKKIYNKLDLMDFKPDKVDIKRLLETSEEPEEFVSHKYDVILNEIENHLDMKKRKFEPVTLNDLIKRFSVAPYGYNDTEIQWLIIKLYTQKRINITKSSTNFNEYTNEKKITIITQRKNYDSILIEKKKQTSIHELNQLKELLTEISGTIVPDKDIPQKLQEEFHILHKKITEIFNRYNKKYPYPGEKLVTESYELFNEIHNITNEEQFIEYMVKEKDNILDYYEDLDDIFKFFEGTRCELFEEGVDTHRLYEENKYNLNNSQLDEYNDKILEIINMEKPYTYIRNLPIICNEFKEEYFKELKTLKDPIITEINEYENSLINELDDEKLTNMFKTKINDSYNDLKNRLDKTKNISEIKGFNSQIINTHEKYQKQIDRYKEQRKNETNQQDKGKIKPTPTEPKIKPKTVYLNELIADNETKIDNDLELNKFMKKLQKELKKQLDLNKKINIKL